MKNGFTRIPNDLLEAIARTKLKSEAGRIFWAIVRLTLGYNKKEATISLGQFQLMTGLRKPNIVRAIKWLSLNKLIISSDNAKYKIHRDFTLWKPLSVVIPLSVVRKKVISSDNAYNYNKEKLKKYMGSNEPGVLFSLVKPQMDEQAESQPKAEQSLCETQTNPPIKPCPAPPSKDPRIRVLINYFCTEYMKIKNSEYIFSKKDGGAVGGMLKKLLKTYQEEDLKELIDWFLNNEKSNKHPSIKSCFSTHSINCWQLWKQKESWRYG